MLFDLIIPHLNVMSSFISVGKIYLTKLISIKSTGTGQNSL